MENITHSLVGGALAELVLPAGASDTQRRLFFGAGILAANLPDADLVYTWITPPPLGYLLHHRGHTHTVAGLLALGVLMVGVCALPPIRRVAGSLRGRLSTLIGVALLSHLVLDAWNSYGVHPFWPVDSRWYYGDAIYILEPWLWVLLGVAAAMNARRYGLRLLLGAAIAALAGALVWLRMTPLAALMALAACAGVLTGIMRRRTARHRSAAALALTALFVASMFGLRERVRARVLSATPRVSGGTVLDVVLSPQPGNPLCWSSIAIASDERTGSYVLARGSAASFAPSGCGTGRSATVQWADSSRQSLRALRELTARDCSVRAWMQFGRAPDMRGGTLSDYRYADRTRDNFSAMQVDQTGSPAPCPRNLTSWGMPRDDLIRGVTH